MTRRSLTGRADLLRAIVQGEDVAADMATRLGFERIAAVPLPDAEFAPEIIAERPSTIPESAVRKHKPVPFWRAETFEVRDVHVTLTDPKSQADAEEGRPVELANFDPLASTAEVLTRLRKVTGLSRPGSRIDVDQVVLDLSRGRQLTEFPFLNRRIWGQELHVVIDLSRRLAPYRQDQQMIGRLIRKLLPKGSGTVSMLRDGSETPIVEWPLARRGHPLSFPHQCTVLALSDLGTLQQPTSFAAQQRWKRIGGQLQDRDCLALALVPCRPDALSSSLLRCWTPIPWERHSYRRPVPTSDTTAKACERIMALLSPAVRIEPRLLRAIRKLFSDGRRDPGLESLVWQQCEETTHSTAAAMTKQQAESRRSDLLNDPLRRAAWALIRAVRRGEYPGVELLEVINLGDHAPDLGAGSINRARDWFRQIGSGDDAEELPAAFFRRAAGQLTRDAFESLPELHQLWTALCGDGTPPDGYEPALADHDRPIQTALISQLGEQLEYRRSGDRQENASQLASLRFRNPRLEIQKERESLSSNWLFGGGEQPAWVSAWGKDEYGYWSEFQLDYRKHTGAAPSSSADPLSHFPEDNVTDLSVTQRMRWIPAGTFVMGSPDDEDGRDPDEGPQHEVTISEGYWMFDTPVTQQLWKTVMNTCPSYFDGDYRPVEQVSWEDCQEFIERLNAARPGLNLSLPTEAQWEYACRAGTQTATYNGHLDIKGDKARQQLRGVAWYSGNSGGRTHDVGENPPNLWGLYDMLGNVYEWCDDHMYREYSSPQVCDPHHVIDESSAERVIRGGGWSSSAQGVRAAYRVWDGPSYRGDYLGFRCSSSGNRPAEQESGRSQRVVSDRSRSGAGGESEPTSEDRWVNLQLADADKKPVPQGPVVKVVSDLEQLTLRQMTRPPWASNFGRDEFGLWAEFQLEGDSSGQAADSRPKRLESAVIQRMRWIPPGRFLMGSPETEVGRWTGEGPQHEEIVPAGFWMFDTPCTQQLWELVMPGNPSRFKGATRPVERVSWDDCQDFVMKLNEHLKGLQLTLPSERQWEYACRGGTDSPIWNSDTQVDTSGHSESLNEIVWYNANSGGATHEVAQKLPNPWGLFDMLGNVWEWCEDNWQENYIAAGSSAGRVIRGGGWLSSAQDVRAAYRDWLVPSDRYDILGFRCSSSGGEHAGGAGTQPSEPRAEPGGDSEVQSDDPAKRPRFWSRLRGAKKK